MGINLSKPRPPYSHPSSSALDVVTFMVLGALGATLFLLKAHLLRFAAPDVFQVVLITLSMLIFVCVFLIQRRARRERLELAVWERRQLLSYPSGPPPDQIVGGAWENQLKPLSREDLLEYLENIQKLHSFSLNCDYGSPSHRLYHEGMPRAAAYIADCVRMTPIGSL